MATPQAASTPQFVAGTPDWVQPLIQQASQKYNIPTAILSALIKQESGFQPNVTSAVGAQGIAQFMPGTARSYGINPLDPAQAIMGAAHYLSDSRAALGNDWKSIIASYNAGVGAVQQFGGVPPYQETQNYVKNILAMAGEIHQSANGPAIDMVQQAKKQSNANSPYNQSMPAPGPRPLPVVNGHIMSPQNRIGSTMPNPPTNLLNPTSSIPLHNGKIAGPNIQNPSTQSVNYPPPTTAPVTPPVSTPVAIASTTSQAPVSSGPPVNYINSPQDTNSLVSSLGSPSGYVA